LILLGVPNHEFRGIVCFQGFNRLFVSPFSRMRIFDPKVQAKLRPARPRLRAFSRSSLG
jgi:hypothetical protein